MRNTLVSFVVLLVAALRFDSPPVFAQAVHAVPTSGQVFRFDASDLAVDTRFPAGRIADCSRIDEDEYRITIRPENAPINNSPWYAFQIRSERPRSLTIRLTYENGTHRYQPKISRDGQRWSPLDPGLCRVEKKGREAVLQIDAGPETLWIAAQELVTQKPLTQWMEGIAARRSGRKTAIGRSLSGRPIEKLEIGSPGSKRVVFLLGRQHPPEVTGSLGLMHFVETIAGESDLAGRFREEFLTVVVPLANPDGVETGYWRHSLGGVDLNRDWSSFTQPETRAIRDEIHRLARKPRQLWLFLDFHSTHQDLFYTQPDDAATFPADFAGDWLGGIQKRFPDYRVRREPTSYGGKPTSMRWVHRTFGTTAITYEWGDRTERDRIREIASGAAVEMMRLLLEKSECPAPVATEQSAGEEAPLTVH